MKWLFHGGGVVLWSPVQAAPGEMHTYAVLTGPKACVVTLTDYTGPTESEAGGWEAFMERVLAHHPLLVIERQGLVQKEPHLHLDDGSGEGFQRVSVDHPVVRTHVVAVAVLGVRMRQVWPEWDAQMTKDGVRQIPTVSMDASVGEA